MLVYDVKCFPNTILYSYYYIFYYFFISLPERFTKTYMVKATSRGHSDDKRKTINVEVDHFPNARFKADVWFLYLHKLNPVLPRNAILINKKLKTKYSINLRVPESE